MNNEFEIQEKETEKKPFYQRPNMIKWLAVILAALILLDALLAVFLIVRANKDDETVPDAELNTGFDYADAVIRDYLPTFSDALFKGKTYAGGEYAIDEITTSYIESLITSELLSKATAENSGRVNKTSPVNYADVVYFYILLAEVEENGTFKALEDEYFVNAYGQLGEAQIGAAVLGKDFDQALIGKTPLELGNVTFREHGFAKDGGETVFVISYSATVDGKDSPFKMANGERFDTGAASGVLADALKAKLSADNIALGETFELTVKEDSDEDGTEETVRYEIALNAAVTEDAYLVSATLPEDYFSSKDELAYLNGKTVRFHVAVDYSVGYEIIYEYTDSANVAQKLSITGIDSLPASFIKDVLLFETDKTDDAEVLEAYKAHRMESEKESLKTSKRANAIAIIWKNLLEDLPFTSLPEIAVNEAQASIIEQFDSYYSYYSQSDASFALYYPTVEDYARAYFGYERGDYESYTDYIEQKETPATVKRQLLIYAIFESGMIENAYSKYAEKIAELKELIRKSALEQGTTLTGDDVISYISSYYGIGNVRLEYITSVVEDFLYENNTVDFTLEEDDS